MDFTNEQAQQLRSYAQSLPEEERKGFIDKFQSLDDSKRSVVIGRLFGNSSADTIPSKQPLQESPLASTEKLISQRPSMIQDLIKDPVTLNRMIQHPVGTPLRAMGGALELTEGVPADIGLALQRGRPQDIAGDIGKTLTGQRPAQRGDIMRAVGVPEDIAATIGLVSGGAKIAPETAGTNALASGMGKTLNVTKLPQIVSKFGNKVVSKFLSNFAQLPEESVSKALSNPNYLKNGWIKKETARVQDEYKKVIQPLLDDNTNQVELSKLHNMVSDLGLMSKSGEWTKNFSSLKPAEARKIIKWEQAVQAKKMSFNQVDALIGEMDSSLDSVYKKTANGQPVDYSNDFIRMTKQFRNTLNQTRKEQFKDAGKVLSDYETVKSAQRINKDFDRWLPHMIPTIVGGAAATTLGLSGAGAYAPLTLGAIPKLQGYGIRTADLIGRNIGKTGAMAPEAAFNEWINNR